MIKSKPPNKIECIILTDYIFHKKTLEYNIFDNLSIYQCIFKINLYYLGLYTFRQSKIVLR